MPYGSYMEIRQHIFKNPGLWVGLGFHNSGFLFSEIDGRSVEAMKLGIVITRSIS